jgi:hypothetical protein
MDNINFASVNSTFNNFILSSIKKEMDVKKGNFSIVIKNKKRNSLKYFS